VRGLELALIPHTQQQLSQRLVKEQARQIRLLRQALRHHIFYFTRGTGTDVTHTLQHSILRKQQHANDKPLLPDSRFFWNEPCTRSIVQENGGDADTLLSRHVIPVTSAFVGVQANITFANDSPYSYDQVLISRRSRFRAGTRFTKRGADGTGAVANYVETEQVCWLYHKQHVQQVSSHVQTRGSIPLRWSSPTDIKTYRPRVRIGTDPLAQARAVQSHLLGEFARYGAIGSPTKYPQLVFINLIDKKQDQGRLGRSFDSVLQAVLEVLSNSTLSVGEQHKFPPEIVKHVWFDFHAEVKHGNWARLGSLLNDVKATLDEQGYFCAVPESKEGWKVMRTQRGVIRTNCMDCLDRTNVVQSIFGRYMLFQQLNDVRNDKKRILPVENGKAFRHNSLTIPWSSGEVSHRLLWADNADAISRLYAGTPALKGDFTRTGKRTKKGALDDGMNSLQRYYLNNFLDADRQEGMDLLTGYADFSIDESVDPDVLRNTALSMLLSSSDKKQFAKRRREAASRALKMRWLPGDLQSHMKSHAWGLNKETKETLEAMEHRAASDDPWWVSDETSSGENSDEDDPVARTNVGTWHLIGAIAAALQAPGVTAASIVCLLGITNTDKKNGR
jgi:hypothetical protein